MAPHILKQAQKLQDEGKPSWFEADVLDRAQAYIDATPSMGAYTHSQVRS